MLARRAVLLLFVPITASTAGGQAPVGRVGEITVIGGAQRCPGRTGSNARRVLRIVRGGGDIQVRRGQSASVLLGDRYRLDRDTDARLDITTADMGRGEFILAPKLLCAISTVDTTLRALVPDSGTYDIARSNAGLLSLEVISGGALIRWTPGSPPLVINAGSRERLFRRFRVTGTDVAIAADTVSRVAVVYVREGLVVIEGRDGGAGEVQVGPGQVYVVRDNLPPSRISELRPEARSLAEADVRHHLAELGPPSASPTSRLGGLLRNPWTYVGLAAAGGGTIWLVSRGDSRPAPPPRRSGTVVIQLPF